MDRNDRLDDDGLLRDDARARASGTTGDEVGEAVGGISGVLTGAALGSLGGPIGTIIGGIAGAVSGWWAGKAISEAARHVTQEDEAFYREHHRAGGTGGGTRTYDDVRPAYQLGHLAGRNPDYAHRSFDEVEPDLQRGWTGDVAARHGEWSSVRGYAREAYDRGRTRGVGTASASSGISETEARGGAGLMGGMETGLGTGGAGMMGAGVAGAAGRSTERIDDSTDRIAMHERDATGRLGDRVEGAWERTKEGARHLADRAEDKLDDAKDRVDGDPASRPGIDRTDDVDRRI